MTFVVILVLVSLGFLAFWYFGRQPQKHVVRQDDLQRFLREPLRRGSRAGWVRIERRKSPQFVQFATYSGKTGAGLELSFPRAPWSEAIYQELVRILTINGLEVERQVVDGGDVSEFLVVDLRGDVGRAEGLAQLILREVFGADRDEMVVVQLHW